MNENNNIMFLNDLNIEISKITLDKNDFNEYILSEYNESALIWPTESYVKKVTNDSLCFYFKFEDISKVITYMNARNSFNILPNSLEVKALIDYKDAAKGSIIYEF